MTGRHPFAWLSKDGQRRLFRPLVAVTLLVLAGMGIVDRRLTTEHAPRGIISFEVAGEPDLARAIVDSWGEEGRIYAGISLGLDYLFLILWTSSLALACVLTAEGFFPVIGFTLAWAAVGAAVLDATENYALIRLLTGSADAAWVTLAWWCAVPKLWILALGLLYVVTGWLRRFVVERPSA